MRMWKVRPELLCAKHLLGEHVEMHMFVGTIARGKSINGFIETGLVEVHSIDCWHEELSREIIRRGFNHNSPLAAFEGYIAGKINVRKNIEELRSRCVDCRGRIAAEEQKRNSGWATGKSMI